MAMSLILALALQGAAPTVQLNSNLKPLAFLVGYCWRGTFPDGRQTDTHCFTPIHGGAFVRDRHVVENGPVPYAGESLYRWDNSARKIRFDYYATDGAYTSGEALPAPDRLRFPEARRAANGSDMQIETSWIPDGANSYFVLSEVLNGENRRTLLRMRMERTGPAAER